MALPFFYKEEITPGNKEIIFDEAASLHIVQVLRMTNGEKLNLTDGKGNLLECEITDAHKKHCKVSIHTSSFIDKPAKKVSIAVSLLKNTSRFEWFLEKATELGVNEIIPLVCDRTIKEKFRYERMHQIVVSAMLQSQQAWLPALSVPVSFEDLVKQKNEKASNFIAHCEEGEKLQLASCCTSQPAISLICIGPEGDFTIQEINLALQNNFNAVSLGQNRLRTETAALVAAVLLTS